MQVLDRAARPQTPRARQNEGITHITRLYLKKLKELRKLKRCLHMALAGKRNFIRAWLQVEGRECRGQMRLTEALVPDRV